MLRLARRLQDRLDDVDLLRRIHGWAVIVWLLLAIPSVLLWRNSVPYLVFVSVYALVVSHWSAWGAPRAEQAQEDTK